MRKIFLILLFTLCAQTFAQVKLSEIDTVGTLVDGDRIALQTDIAGTYTWRALTWYNLNKTILDKLFNATGHLDITGDYSALDFKIKQSVLDTLTFELEDSSIFSNHLDPTFLAQIVRTPFGLSQTLNGNYTFSSLSNIYTTGLMQGMNNSKWLVPLTTGTVTLTPKRLETRLNVGGGDDEYFLRWHYGLGIDTLMSRRFLREEITSADIKAEVITLGNLASSLVDYIDASGGGTITNFPDEVTLTSTGGIMSVKDAGLSTVKYQDESVTGDKIALNTITGDNVNSIPFTKMSGVLEVNQMPYLNYGQVVLGDAFNDPYVGQLITDSYQDESVTLAKLGSDVIDLINTLSGGGLDAVKKKSFSLTVADPTNTDDIILFRTEAGITIDSVYAVFVGGDSIDFNIVFDDSVDNAGTSVYTTDKTVTSATTGNKFTSGDEPYIPQSAWIRAKITAVVGVVTQFSFTVYYTKD